MRLQVVNHEKKAAGGSRCRRAPGAWGNAGAARLVAKFATAASVLGQSVRCPAAFTNVSARHWMPTQQHSQLTSICVSLNHQSPAVKVQSKPLLPCRLHRWGPAGSSCANRLAGCCGSSRVCRNREKRGHAGGGGRAGCHHHAAATTAQAGVPIVTRN